MDIEVEPLKANTVVKGDGPYKWIPSTFEKSTFEKSTFEKSGAKSYKVI
jgi:hypothetical protein